MRNNRMDNLMEQASRMMDVAGKAARTHQRYLKAIADSQDIQLSSDSD